MMDADGDGNITKAEFQAFHEERRGPKRPMPEEAELPEAEETEEG